MNDLSELDPTRGDDPRLDPHGDTARGARAAAIVRGDAPAPASRRSTRRRLLPALGATGLAATIAAGVLLTGGGDGGLATTDALAQAAADTAEVRSGALTFTTRVGEPSGVQGVTQQVVRFDGADVAMTNVTDQIAPGQDTVRTTREEVVVDGRHWVKKDDAGWVRKTEDTAGDASDLRGFVEGEVDDRPLADLVRGDDDVRQDGDVYRATVSRADLAGLDHAPLGLDDAPADWGDEIPVALTIADGLIAKVEVRIPKGILSAEYAGLGEPQAIEEPAAG